MRGVTTARAGLEQPHVCSWMPQETVEQAMREVSLDDGNTEKSMNFSNYVKIQTSAQKINRISGLKDDATMVPQVKPLVYHKDPNLSHLM